MNFRRGQTGSECGMLPKSSIGPVEVDKLGCAGYNRNKGNQLVFPNQLINSFRLPSAPMC